MLRLLACLFLISIDALACTEPGVGFLPDTNRKIPVDFKNSGLTFEEYNTAIDKVSAVYSPIARSYGARLIMERKWESETINAGTLRSSQGDWIVNLYGGFARHPFITRDGYMLVICHEIGHHIGGAPKKQYAESGSHWASTEGQSDYFATLKCLRKVFRKDNNEEIIKDMDIPENIRAECTRSFPIPWEVALCLRTSMAGVSVAKVNADIRRVPLPEIEVVDSTIVSTTSNNHPVPQCRLNTYYQGSICVVPSTKSLSQKNDVKGTCHESLGHTTGLRPGCWYSGK